MKKKKPIIYYMLIFLFIIFSCVYIVSESGYYEYTLQGKTILTKEKIIEFEKDIYNGENIDLKKYYQEEKSYANRFTNSINNVSINIRNISRKFMKKLFRLLNNYFSD